jgi:hypothetical protein
MFTNIFCEIKWVLHIKFCNRGSFKSLVNVRIKSYNKMYDHVKELDDESFQAHSHK